MRPWVKIYFTPKYYLNWFKYQPAAWSCIAIGWLAFLSLLFIFDLTFGAAGAALIGASIIAEIYKSRKCKQWEWELIAGPVLTRGIPEIRLAHDDVTLMGLDDWRGKLPQLNANILNIKIKDVDANEFYIVLGNFVPLRLAKRREVLPDANCESLTWSWHETLSRLESVISIFIVLTAFIGTTTAIFS